MADASQFEVAAGATQQEVLKQLDEAMAKIGNAMYRSSLDFKNGFYQNVLDEKEH